MTPEKREHIKRLLQAKGLKPRTASLAIGRNEHFVRDYLSGKVRSPAADAISDLATLLGTSVEGLEPTAQTRGPRDERWDSYEHDPRPPQRRPVRTAPTLAVRYEVQAGTWVEPDDTGQALRRGPPVAADPAFPSHAQWLERVRGDSVNLEYPDGTWVHVVDAIEIGYAPRDEDFVVVTRTRAQGGLVERTIKQVLMKARGRIELWPRSTNPKWKTPVRLDGVGEEATVEIAALVIGGYRTTRR